ncbi:MAG: M48 family metalloprotease [Desulfobacteraceae bacterium]|jgi:beta-barrel assembly-enhancing protease|nr:M48 family metalloprotease [Desulfobacteraceae bacterium]
MTNYPLQSYSAKGITRRDFLWLTTLSIAGFATGCATNPVTGQKQLMLVSESHELDIDQKNSPHQFSADYGISQDKNLNNYINNTGRNISSHTHRPSIPYSFRCVNATYVNAYAFPGGSIAVTRGILLSLNSEAQLSALLCHEMGHINARHTARQMTKGMVTQAIMGGVAIYAGTKDSRYSNLAVQLGMLGAGALLAAYSRSNEREADSLGLEYMVSAGYTPNGMTELMGVLKRMSKHKPNAIELMFATHPMSDERYQNTIESIDQDYKSNLDAPEYRERYMDNTSKLRAIKGAIEAMQKGEKEMAKQNYVQAEKHFEKGLKQAPLDYTGLVMMAKCQLALKKPEKALRYSEKAKKVYPKEAQGHHLSGFAKIKKRKFDSAYEDFRRYDMLLPGNPNTTFFKGLALEGTGKKEQAANMYYRYLQAVNQGEQAGYSYNKLVKWGYLKQK